MSVTIKFGSPPPVAPTLVGMKVWVGYVETNEGSANHYAAESEKGLRRQIAAFCAEWWDQDGPGSDMPIDGLSDNEIINLYFDASYGEDYNLAEVVIMP